MVFGKVMASGKLFRISAALGGTGVVFGAFGAHALRERLTVSGMLEVWRTGVQYHLIHAVAYLVIAALASVSGPARAHALERVGLYWLIGVICFSGSLYWLALGAPRWVGPITPIGGLCFIIGWVMLGFVKTEAPGNK